MENKITFKLTPEQTAQAAVDYAVKYWGMDAYGVVNLHFTREGLTVEVTKEKQ